MAGKKKGAKKGGKRKETEEEKALRLQAEAVAAEEKQRQALELARAALRQRQAREARYASANAPKITAQWRKALRAAKVEELLGEVEAAAQTHTRHMDACDADLQALEGETDEAEAQHRRAVAAHLGALSALERLQAARLDAGGAAAAAAAAELTEEFERERADLSAAHARVMREMGEVAAAMRAAFAEAEAEARTEYEGAREEVRNKESEEYNVTKIQLEGAIDDLEKHFEQAHRAYQESTEHRSAAFKALTSADATAAHAIEGRMKRLAGMMEELAHWRAKIVSSARHWDARNGALRHEKDLMVRHYTSLKAALDAQRSAQAQRLKQLSVASAACMQDLRAKVAKAEAILKLGRLCRRFETEAEKVLPFCSLDEAVPLPPADPSPPPPATASHAPPAAGEEAPDAQPSASALGSSGWLMEDEMWVAASSLPDSDCGAWALAATTDTQQPDDAAGVAETAGDSASQQAAWASGGSDGTEPGGGGAGTAGPALVQGGDVLRTGSATSGSLAQPSAGGGAAGASSGGGHGGDSGPVRWSGAVVDDAGVEVEEWDCLTRFFRRYNKVTLDKAAIDQEAARLTQENSDLRQLLKRFLDGVSVNDAVMDNPANPLLVVNGKLQASIAAKRLQSAPRTSITPTVAAQGAALPLVPAAPFAAAAKSPVPARGVARVVVLQEV